MDRIETDVLVVGSGGAGLTAALVTAKQGLRVTLIEKTDLFGGTTAWSGGGIWAPCNSLARSEGVADSPELALSYLKQSIGPTIREDLAASYIENAPKMVDYLQAHTDVQFKLQSGFPDWYQEVPGALEGGRLLTPTNFNGLELGDYFDQLRPPLREFNAPGGVMIGLEDMPHIANVRRSLKSFRYIVGIIGRFLWDRLRHGRGTRLTMGNALVARLLKSCVTAGVTLKRNCAMERLLIENGAVRGAITVDSHSRNVEISCTRGVVLASGGFSANKQMREKFFPYADQHISLVNEGNTGDGINAALKLGASFDGENHSNAGWVVISKLEQPGGHTIKFPHLFMDRGKPGCIAVNAQGKRFGNEATTNLVEPMHRTGSVPAHLICDSSFIKKYGLGLVKPGGIGLKKLLGKGYILSAPTITELASIIEADAANLEATVSRFNSQAELGVDEDFGRGAEKENYDLGDMNHKPNPCLGPIENAPFYAVKIYPGNSTTTVGLRIDGEARVVATDNSPICGLYAAGLDMNSLWRGKAPGHGSNNGLSLTFGYIAGMSLAKNN